MDDKPKKRGCLTGCLAAIGLVVVVMFLIFVFVAIFGGSSEESDTVSSDSKNSGNSQTQNQSDDERENDSTDDDKSDKSTAGSSKGNVTVSTPVVVKYTNSLGELHYGFFFSYKNDGGSPVAVNSMDITVFDNSHVAIDTPMSYSYAPEILEPGETGFCGCLGLNYDNLYPTDGISVEASTNYFSTDEKAPLSCSDATLVDNDFSTGNVPGKAVSVTVTNNTDETLDSCPVVVGFFDASGTMIGFAQGYADTVPANGQGRMTCDEIELTEGKTTADITTIEARAKSMF